MVNLLADFVVRFNVAAKKNSEFFFVPYSKTNFKIIELLYLYRCIRTFSYEVHPTTKVLRLKVALFFFENKSLIRKLDLISRPGAKIYWSASEFAYKFSRNNFQGFFILSTQTGICSSNEL